MNNIELRWYIKDSEKVLQYRYQTKVLNYSFITDEITFPTVNSWSEWIDVPIVNND
jgi:hypothetical protein